MAAAASLEGTLRIPRLCLKMEVARQVSSRSVCASVRAVPWEDEAEQQLSRLAPSACQLPADIRIFEEELLQGAWQGQHPIQGYVGILRCQEKQAPQSLCLCVSSAMGR